MIDLKDKMQAELADLPFIQGDFKLIQFNGGTVNSSYRLESGDKRYFVKTFESDEMALLDRESLFSIQQSLAKQGLSVLPVYLSKINHFQIDLWVDDLTLDSVTLSDVEMTKTLASILAKIHSLELDAPRLDLPRQWQHYQKIIHSRGSEINADDLESMLATWQQACTEKMVFCHNDLALAHITHSPSPIVFDWEYCAISCPFFDLASCLKVNGLNATDQASLCAYYAQLTDIPLLDVVNKVRAMQPVVDFTYSLWYQSANILG
jgi:thiamine kinase-like enzyme